MTISADLLSYGIPSKQPISEANAGFVVNCANRDHKLCEYTIC